MYYIVSPIPIEELKKYKNTNPRDIKKFYKTIEGKKFAEINPLIIRQISNKNAGIALVSFDINVIGLCYDCPLYITFLNDKTYYKAFNLGIWEHRNIKKCEDMQENGTKPEIKIENQYFGGDLSTVLHKCQNDIKFDLKKQSMVKYLLKNNEITIIED